MSHLERIVPDFQQPTLGSSYTSLVSLWWCGRGEWWVGGISLHAHTECFAAINLDNPSHHFPSLSPHSNSSLFFNLSILPFIHPLPANVFCPNAGHKAPALSLSLSPDRYGASPLLLVRLFDSIPSRQAIQPSRGPRSRPPLAPTHFPPTIKHAFILTAPPSVPRHGN